jgi:drug/metabolite transporter (DMT)-like permease
MATLNATRPALRPVSGTILIGVAVILWSTMDLLGALLPRGLSVPMIVLARYTSHLVALLLLTAPRSGLSVLRTGRPGLQIARGLLMIGMPLCFAAAVRSAAPETVLSIFWITPLLIAGSTTFLLHEPVSARQWAAAIVAGAGAELALHPSVINLAAIALPALGMAICFSLYLIMTRQLRDERTATSLFYTAAVVLVPLALAAPIYWQPLQLQAWPVLVAIGLTGLGALFAFDKACERLSPARLAPIICFQPILMSVVAALATGGHPGWRTAAAAALVLGATLFGSLER